MSRGIKDLRELINVSRLSFHGEDKDFEYHSSDEDEFRLLQRRVATPAPTEFKDRKKKAKKEGKVTRSVELNPRSPLPPISASRESSASSSSSRHSSTSPVDTSEISPTATPIPPAPTRKFQTNRKDFDDILKYMDESNVNEWLVRANNAVEFLSAWGNSTENVLEVAQFWIKDVLPSQWTELIRMEVGIVIDEISFSLASGRGNKSIRSYDLVELLISVLKEFPKELCGNKMCFLNFLFILCSQRDQKYRKMLSDVRCVTRNRKYIQWILALRAFALTNLCQAVVQFYTTISEKEQVPQSSSTEQAEGKEPQDLQSLLVNCVFQAIDKGYTEVVDSLLGYYWEELKNAKSSNGKNLLFTAILSGKEQIIKILIKHGCDVNAAASSGNSPLQAAINLGNTGVVKQLIIAGADVNYFNPDCEGATPLHLAIMQGNDELVSILLAAGADSSARMGVPATVTPLSLAQDLGQDDIVKLLEKLSLD